MTKCPFCVRPLPDPAAAVCPHCVRALPHAVAAGPAPTDGRKIIGWARLLVLLVLLAGTGAWAYRQYRPATPLQVAPETVVPTTTVAPPLDVAIADTAAVKVDAGRYLAFPFTGGGRSTCHVEGRVRALAGGDRRVNVFIVDADGLATLESGGTPRTYYESGPLPVVALSLNVDGRSTYTIVVSNARSSRAKSVALDHLRASCTD